MGRESGLGDVIRPISASLAATQERLTPSYNPKEQSRGLYSDQLVKGAHGHL